MSRTAAIKAAILEATVPEHASAIADMNEILVLLTDSARSGSVPAMQTLLRHHLRLPRPVAAANGILEELDELAARGHHKPSFTIDTYVHLLDDDLGAPLGHPSTGSSNRPSLPVIEVAV